MIGNEISVEVISVSGDGVRLGISAPETTPVHRYEVFIEIENANRAAGAAAAEIGQVSLEDLSIHLRSLQQK